jgi:hypothetical protein
MAVGPQHASSPPDRLLGGQLVASRRRLSRSGRFRSWLTGRGQLRAKAAALAYEERLLTGAD